MKLLMNYLIICILILFLYFIYYCFLKVKQAHQIWNWANENWFPYKQFMNQTEIEYIQSCLSNLFWDYLSRPFLVWFQHHLPYLSSFTYGVSYNGKDISPSRIGFGLVGMIGSSKLEKEAIKVLESHHLIKPNTNGTFGGLAWNFDEKSIRMYYKVNISYFTHTDFPIEEYYSIGLQAWTWDINSGKLLDTKEYIFDKQQYGAWMYSEKREQWIYQDNESSDKIPPELNKYIQKWNEFGYQLDTISHWGTDWVLYFPRITFQSG